MTIELIQGMINNSTWIDQENDRLYQFSKGKDLAINGKNHILYSLHQSDNKIVLELSTNKSYFVDYVNDFILNLHNDAEKFKITVD